MGEEDEPNAFFNLHPEDTRATGSCRWSPPVAPRPTSPTLRGWLATLATDADRPFGAPADYTVPLPLLQHAAALERRAGDRRRRPGRGPCRPRRPARPDRWTAPGDPVGELERLMRETLGVASYRLDAWFTAVAAWRLENKRRRGARGRPGRRLRLRSRTSSRARRAARPRATCSRPRSRTPPPPRSCAAAGRRSADRGESGALAVDLSSDRVRRARWLVDGVRAGQDLAGCSARASSAACTTRAGPGRPDRRVPHARARRPPATRRLRPRSSTGCCSRAAGSQPTRTCPTPRRRAQAAISALLAGADDERAGARSGARRARRRPGRGRRRRGGAERLLARPGQRCRERCDAHRGGDRRRHVPGPARSPTRRGPR